ncbi:MAG: response regulator [Clostridia bacterium]|nr:response regulator [Clostridia bacterium]
MLNWVIYAMVYLGAALMVYNVYSYIRYARRLQKKKKWGKERRVLYIPIFLLVMFLFGYLAVGLFGKPDLIVSGILFGGSIFVFIIFYVLEQITNRIQENEQLEAEVIALEKSNQAKTDFLSSMSHEMRTPLNAIIGLDTLVIKHPALPEECRERMKGIDISARHLLELINHILEMGDLEKGELELQEAPFSLRDTLSLASIITQTQCDEKGLIYETSIPDSLDDAYVGDEIKIKQTLLSILGNAVKFTPAPGAVKFTVEQTSGEGRQRQLRFIIQDTGIGMDEKLLSNLFTPFTRGDDTSTNPFGGTGLALAISKKFIDLMDGTIAVTSMPGIGSTFTVSLNLTATEKQEEAPLAESEAVTLEGRRVLIVEDIELNAEIVADLLEMEGMLTDWAENGKLAVDLFSDSPVDYYDAIPMDLRMPVMDGLEAARAIRALDRADAKAVPILALTANAFEEDVRNTLEAGMNEHLSKPVDAELLYENLRRFISRREAAS